jgi:hypothetical protein
MPQPVGKCAHCQTAAALAIDKDLPALADTVTQATPVPVLVFIQAG